MRPPNADTGPLLVAQTELGTSVSATQGRSRLHPDTSGYIWQWWKRLDPDRASQEGVPSKQPKRGRLWLNDGSGIRLRAEWADHVWSYDFAHRRTHDGRAFRMLNVLDEFTRESLAIRVRGKLSSSDVIDVLKGVLE